METELHPLLPPTIVPTARPDARLEDRASFHAFFASQDVEVEPADLAAITSEPEVEGNTTDQEDGVPETAPDGEATEKLADDDAFELPFLTKDIGAPTTKKHSTVPQPVLGSVRSATIAPQPTLGGQAVADAPIETNSLPLNEILAFRSTAGETTPDGPAAFIPSRAPATDVVPVPPFQPGAHAPAAQELPTIMREAAAAVPFPQRPVSRPSLPEPTGIGAKQFRNQTLPVTRAPSTPASIPRPGSSTLRAPVPLAGDPVQPAQQANHAPKQVPQADRTIVQESETPSPPASRHIPSDTGMSPAPDSDRTGISVSRARSTAPVQYASLFDAHRAPPLQGPAPNAPDGPVPIPTQTRSAQVEFFPQVHLLPGQGPESQTPDQMGGLPSPPPQRMQHAPVQAPTATRVLPPAPEQVGTLPPHKPGAAARPQPAQQTAKPIAQTASEQVAQIEAASVAAPRPTRDEGTVAPRDAKSDLVAKAQPSNHPKPTSPTPIPTSSEPAPAPRTMSADTVLLPTPDDAPAETLAPLFGHEAASTRAPATAAAAKVTLPAETPDLPARMADVLVTKAGQQVEIALRPEELGSVRMALSFNETGAVVTVAAERAETLDLIRRHADALADALRDLGHGSVGFSFGDMGQDADPQSSSNTSQGDPLADPHTSQHPPEAPAPKLGTSGLDLRL